MATQKPWEDWPDTEVESDLDAGWFVKDNEIFKGFEDRLFHPNIPITSFQFCNVLERADIEVDRGYFKTTDVFMKDTQVFMPNTAWSSNPEELATRFRTSVMVYRYKNDIPAPFDDIVAERIEQLFREKPVTWKGVKRYSRLIGYGKTIVEDSRKYNVPIWLALGQCWRESQFFCTGLSIDYNCGWGLKDSKCRWGAAGNPTHVRGFTNYCSVEECIHAYFRLMSSPDMPYRALIDKYYLSGNMSYIYRALDIFAPSYENDTKQHHSIVKTVKRWCDERGIK